MTVNINYDEKTKELPCKRLQELFVSVGWSDGTETPDIIANYNVPFINSTLVISAWHGDCLVGVVRVLSDRMFRSIIYDLIVIPEFQGMGIGTELVRRCVNHFPNSEWLAGTIESTVGFYEKIGFTRGFDKGDGVILSIPCKWFTGNISTEVF